MRNEITIHNSSSLVGFIRNEITTNTMHFARQRGSDVLLIRYSDQEYPTKRYSNLYFLARGRISLSMIYPALNKAQQTSRIAFSSI